MQWVVSLASSVAPVELEDGSRIFSSCSSWGATCDGWLHVCQQLVRKFLALFESRDRPRVLSRLFFLFTWGASLSAINPLQFFARSSSFMVSSLFHGCMIDLELLPSNHGPNSLVSQRDSNPIRWQFSVVVALALLPSSDMVSLQHATSDWRSPWICV